MRDLMRLSKKHNIEAKLFNSDGIENIYKALGDSRMTRWFESICDEDLANLDLWERLIVFL